MWGTVCHVLFPWGFGRGLGQPVPSIVGPGSGGLVPMKRQCAHESTDIDGTRDAGLTVQIEGPGGIVRLDAGQMSTTPDGDVLYTHGPHPQLSGETFCPALVP